MQFLTEPIHRKSFLKEMVSTHWEHFKHFYNAIIMVTIRKYRNTVTVSTIRKYQNNVTVSVACDIDFVFFLTLMRFEHGISSLNFQ